MNSKSKQTLSGILLLGAALVAIVWANSAAAGAYEALHDLAWLPAIVIFIFFATVGIELRQEFSTGSLSKPSQAALPFAAALGGMAVPALVFTAINLPTGSLAGWAVPMSTDIAFALATLAIFGSRLPKKMRAFLLTVAVVDDVLAILVIAVFYTSNFSLLSLASVAGVVLGLLLPKSVGHQAASKLVTFNSLIGLPIFVLFEAGVHIDAAELGAVLGSPVAIGVIVGLVLGKPAGILLGTWVASRFSREKVDWADLLPVALLGGVGFTVALLMNSLSFEDGSQQSAAGTLGVLIGSATAATLAVILMRTRVTNVN